VVLAATEIPIVLTEVALATLFSFTLVAPLGLPWWTPLVAFCAILAAVAENTEHYRRRLIRQLERLGHQVTLQPLPEAA
jgi:hypothetical protein